MKGDCPICQGVISRQNATYAHQTILAAAALPGTGTGPPFNMNKAASLAILFVFCLGCRQPSLDLNALRKSFSDTMKGQISDAVHWEKMYDSLDKRSVDSPMRVLSSLTRLIRPHQYASQRVADLYFLQGNIYYRIDSFQRAVTAYSNANLYGTGPIYLSARAGAYL